MAIGIALIGADDFAQELLPAIDDCPDLELKAIYSTSRTSAEAVANRAEVDAFYDDPEQEAWSLDALLHRDDIQAVTIALPVSIQPKIVLRSLKAGKHVLSERPTASTVDIVEGLLKWYDAQDDVPLWSVGERSRFIEPILYGRHILKGMDQGRVQTFSLRLHGLVDERNMMHDTLWRRNAVQDGGLLLDGGMHFVAALRFLLSAINESITRVVAFPGLARQELSPRDTLSALIRISNGNSGLFSISYGTRFSNVFDICIVTDKGSVTVTPASVTVSTAETKVPRTRPFQRENGRNRELAVFAKGIENGHIEARGDPREALMDLKVTHAILQSAKEGGSPQNIS